MAKKLAREIWIVGAKRTAFGTFGGALKDFTATDLAVTASQAALAQAGAKPEQVDEVIFGNVQQTSADAIYLARHVGLRSGVPIAAPALTLNRLCGSGFQAVVSAAQQILLGESEVVLAGGAESMSQAPHVVRGARWGLPLGKPNALGDTLWDALTDSYTGMPMAITAENLAEQYKIPRAEVDAYALRSQQAWAAANEAGRFKDEIAPVEVKSKKGPTQFVVDEHPRPQTTMEILAKLAPVFKKDGVVTAGNASGICDGAAALLVCSKEAAERNGWKPLGRIANWGVAGCDPKIMGIGPAPAIRRALDRSGTKLADYDLIEVNEAFSAQYIAVEKELGLDRARTNVNGGAIALGHPLGASGARIVTHLLYELARRKGKLAIGSACIGGGQGIAVVLESIEMSEKELPSGAEGDAPDGSLPVLREADIIYDWNSVEKVAPLARGKFSFFDETLRDGIQSPSVTDPKIDDKIKIIHLMDAIGVDHIDIGLPGAGPRAVEDVATLAREIRDAKLKIKPACAARTHVNDIRPVIEISQKIGIEIEVMAFIGSSPVRHYAEEWSLDKILQLSAEAIDLAVSSNLPITYVTEDTTRSRPEVLAALFRNAIEHGARRLCLCDTVGHSTPDGIKNLLHFTRSVINGLGVKVGLDWHGHNDRGLGVTNSIHAIEFGADRCHGTILGVGERVGNAALDQILVNLALLGEIPDRDLGRLPELVHLVSQACKVPIPYNYPVFGQDAFRTATGVHAAAIIKAEKRGHAFLADRIYSGVPAGRFGREQEIEIGFMSGESNVVYWLKKRGIDPQPGLVKHIFALAKRTDHLLTEGEIRQAIQEYR